MNSEISSGEYFCPLCSNKVEHFIPLQGELTKEYAKHKPAPVQENGTQKAVNRFVMELFAPQTFSCPFCGGMDRERLVAMFLLRHLGVAYRNPNFRLLEFAPRPAIAYF